MKREFWVKEKKIAFITLPGKGGHSKQNALKTVPSPTPLERFARHFIVKRRDTGFQIGIRIGTDMQSSFFGGILFIKAAVRRSQPDHDGGLLGYCLE